MGRYAYLADVNSANTAELPVGITEFKPGEDDGSFVLKFVRSGMEPIELQAMIPEVSDYPNRHSWFIYSTSDLAPASVNKALDDADWTGLRINPMLWKLTTILHRASSEDIASDHESDNDFEYVDDEDMTDVFEEEAYDDPRSQETEDDETTQSQDTSDHSYGPTALSEQQQELQKKIQSDLYFAKQAGFRVSGAGRIFDGGSDCFVTLACRVAKLGLQEDIHQAWHLNPRQYVLLIIRYPEGYKTLGQVLSKSNTSLVQLKLVLADDYKMSYTQAIRIFAKNKIPGARHHVESTLTEPLFIDRPLNELLNERLLTLLRYRQELGLTWTGAENYYNDSQGKQVSADGSISSRYHEMLDAFPPHLPSLATADHLLVKGIRHSLPLASMQLALRHLVRCTEFCLVCHSHVGNSFEALKPYVCSKPLCLYQYMSLGFGPSVESELLSQPDVVDLLISFCYSAAGASVLGNKTKLPIGMGLTVPPYHDTVAANSGPPQPRDSSSDYTPATVYNGVLDDAKGLLTVALGTIPMIKPGQWIYITGSYSHSQHRRVREIWGNTFHLGPKVLANPRERELESVNSSWHARGLAIKTHMNKPQEVRFAGWSHQFDALNGSYQQRAIISLLNSLPSVVDMREYVVEAGMKDGCLSDWKETISPAALGLLRWIIASNRSCIVQVDGLHGNESREAGVKGLPQKFVQFRFAQGAPDKEQRFVESVNAVRRRLKSDFPTIFAFHGSPLQNWHNIVREGLNFDIVAHGRAFGDGIYHAFDLSISAGYSRGPQRGAAGAAHGTALSPYWPNSRLRVQSAICLNEIVNAPNEFIAKSPYLVVQHAEWVQTRYLFVQTMIPEESIKRKDAVAFLEQDANHKPVVSGTDAKEVKLPIKAIPRSRAALVNTRSQQSSGRLVAILQPSIPAESQHSGEVEESEESSDEDVALYTTSGKDDEAITRNDASLHGNVRSDFQPGTLKGDTLLLLTGSPCWATTLATKALQRELKRTLQVLQKEGTYSLGWYLDSELVNNIYQWIFELHSFDEALPLAQDLKAKKATSVVLEVRFGPNFPYAPPFVRVIRPRFVPFLQGGGGHVTHGGAMCMELLTNTGWNPATDMEALLLQIRMALTSTDPQPARLEKGNIREYGLGEAAQAYRRACELHGWKVPPDVDVITSQGMPPSKRGRHI